ncbi:MAG: HAD-IIB family hydrolase, partial [Tuberibacillus sp.]
MEPYLIALDLDGTLLMSDKKIGARTKEVIEKVREAGHLVMFATGRPYRASKEYYFELGLDTPIVNFNGAYIHHPLDAEWGVFHHPIPLETINQIIDTCLEFNLQNIIVEVMDNIYIKNPDPAL